MKKLTMKFITGVAAVGLMTVGAFAEELSLKGKTIGVTVLGTSHHWDLQAYTGQVDELKRLGAEVIALDAERNDQTQINQIQTLIAQKPDAIIQQLGNIKVLDPWLKRVRDADIPLFTVDTITEHSVNNTTSNNYGIGSDLALQIADDMGGKGKLLVFNGFYSVPVCKIRYDQLKYVMGNFAGIEMIEPELKDVAPNTVQQAFADVTDMLTKFDKDSGLKAVWACWDRPSVGATQAVEKAGRDVKVYGIDGSPDFVEMILDPKSPAAGVAAQQPYEIGKNAAINVAKYLNGQDVAPVTFVPSTMITKANAAEVAKDFLPKK